MYRDAAETWRGWPRSLNMRDATRPLWRWFDSALLVLTLALPVPLLAILLGSGGESSPARASLLVVNGALLLVRALLLFAIAPSFVQRGAAFWLSPLADPLASLRVIETTIRRPREWRGLAR